jgi:phosphohistidine phosphatase SixA
MNGLCLTWRVAATFLIAGWCSCWAAAGAARTVVLVRHAERAGGMSADVGISKQGQCRAEALARMLADAGVNRIFVTEVARTAQTAEPLARKLGIRPEVVPAQDVAGLAAKLRAGPPGGAALVVAHSNTAPKIVHALGAGSVPPIADTEYDRLFVITLSNTKQASVVALRYPGCPE